MSKFKKPKRVNQIMDEMDSPHTENFDLTKVFQQQGASMPTVSRPLIDAFCRSYENVDSEHLAHELFSMGRLREYFSAWIVPRMPDILSEYINELDACGYPMRTGFDGYPYIMVRYRGATDAEVEEIEE